jgi:beta-lactamase superfamily II metal-dependent hydrolase
MPNYKYTVHDVGDALFSLFEHKDDALLLHRSIFDIGYSYSGAFDAVNSNEYIDAKTLVISHYHKDHYNGLNRIANYSLQIENLVIPKLPLQTWYADGIMSYLAIQLFYYAEITGFYETDLLRIIQRKNSRQFNVLRRCAGESFRASNFEFDVIWPDTNFLTRRNSITSAMTEIGQVIETNKAFKKFYDEVLASAFFNPNITSSEPFDNIDQASIFDVVLNDEERNLIKRANDKLVRAANDICLAFHDSDRKFLSLGDLSRRALDVLFNATFTTPVIYEVVLSAHHGTHISTDGNWRNISSCVVVHSNGPRMSNYYDLNYNQWTLQEHQTYINGVFDSIGYLRNCKLKYYLS